MSITTLASIPWSGNLPGYAAVAGSFWACAVPNAGTIQLSTGETIALPASVNDVRVSRGGKWAWQRNDTGDLYEGLTRVGPGFGRNSFLYVGETLRTQPAAFPPDQGWAYVNASGSIVTYGAFYHNPPLANAVQYPDVWIGQGQTDGCCVSVPGEPQPRLLRAGNCDFFSVDRVGDAFTIAIVDDAAHVTVILSASLADLQGLPLVAAPNPTPSAVPVPEPPPMSYDPTTPSTWTDDQLRASIASELHAVNSSDDPAYWFGVIRQHSQGADWPYWKGRIDTGDGVGKGDAGPAPIPSPTPAPSPDLSALLASVAALETRISALENKPQPAPSVDPTVAHKGDPVSVTGHVAFSFFGSTFTSKDATWTGKVEG